MPQYPQPFLVYLDHLRNHRNWPPSTVGNCALARNTGLLARTWSRLIRVSWLNCWVPGWDRPVWKSSGRISKDLGKQPRIECRSKLQDWAKFAQLSVCRIFRASTEFYCSPIVHLKSPHPFCRLRPAKLRVGSSSESFQAPRLCMALYMDLARLSTQSSSHREYLSPLLRLSKSKAHPRLALDSYACH